MNLDTNTLVFLVVATTVPVPVPILVTTALATATSALLTMSFSKHTGFVRNGDDTDLKPTLWGDFDRILD